LIQLNRDSMSQGAGKAAFRSQKPCPATGNTAGACPGYVIDHIKALKHGGTDTPGNMQWQTVAEARAKDRVEFTDPEGLSHSVDYLLQECVERAVVNCPSLADQTHIPPPHPTLSTLPDYVG
jgi:hypothetical protein